MGFFSLLSFQKVMGENTCSLKIPCGKIEVLYLQKSDVTFIVWKPFIRVIDMKKRSISGLSS